MQSEIRPPGLLEEMPQDMPQESNNPSDTVYRDMYNLDQQTPETQPGDLIETREDRERSVRPGYADLIKSTARGLLAIWDRSAGVSVGDFANAFVSNYVANRYFESRPRPLQEYQSRPLQEYHIAMLQDFPTLVLQRQREMSHYQTETRQSEMQRQRTVDIINRYSLSTAFGRNMQDSQYRDMIDDLQLVLQDRGNEVPGRSKGQTPEQRRAEVDATIAQMERTVEVDATIAQMERTVEVDATIAQMERTADIIDTYNLSTDSGRKVGDVEYQDMIDDLQLVLQDRGDQIQGRSKGQTSKQRRAEVDATIAQMEEIIRQNQQGQGSSS